MKNPMNTLVASQAAMLLKNNVLSLVKKIYIVPDREEFRHGDDVYEPKEEMMYTLLPISTRVEWTSELLDVISKCSDEQFIKNCNYLASNRNELEDVSEQVPRLLRVRAGAFQLMISDFYNQWANAILADNETNKAMKEGILEMLKTPEMADVMSVMAAYEHCSLSSYDVTVLSEKMSKALATEDTAMMIEQIGCRYIESFERVAA